MTWPNVLVLKYLRQSGQITPELEAKARLNINLGYQRMVTFHHPDTGGFSWFGQDPEHLVLTAYGLMEMKDISDVQDIDETILDSAAQFLAERQNGDGSWTPDEDRYFYTGESVGQSLFQTTAFVTWALHRSDRQQAAAAQGRDYIETHVDDAETTFAKALAAVVLQDLGETTSPAYRQLVDDLVANAVVTDATAIWGHSGAGALYDLGYTADLETTALAAMVLCTERPDLASRALAQIVASKDTVGTFGSTQATVFSLKALLSCHPTVVADGTLDVFLNGQRAAQLHVTPDNSDVFRVVDLKNLLTQDANEVSLLFSGSGSLSYQILGEWYVPWADVPPEDQSPLHLEVTYDRSELYVNDMITVTVRVTNLRDQSFPMVIVDVGTPPGFEPVEPDLRDLVQQDVIANYETTDRQVILYLRGLAANETLELAYRIRATMAFSGTGPGSRAYVYYQRDETMTFAPPVEVSVDVR